MNDQFKDSRLAIISVPGIQPKPLPDLHRAQQQRCLRAGVVAAGGSAQEADAIIELFQLVGWSFDFYREHGDLDIDLPGIERLLAGMDDAEADSREALSFGRRFTGALYALWDRLPYVAELLATPRMEAQLKEIRRYFNDQQGAGSAARDKVRAAIKAAWDADQSVLLIGHSFGSVIAYDVLWEFTHEPEYAYSGGVIDLFISMGSPLTLNFMRRHIKGAHKRGVYRYPAGIRKWVNLAAVGEVTALDRKLVDCFNPMLRLGLVNSIEDNMELINQFHGPAGLNVHKCYGYFASPVAGKLLLDWYREQSSAVKE